MEQQPLLLDDGIVPTAGTNDVTLEMNQALIPPGMRAVEEALVAEVMALAGPRYAREDGQPEVERWGAQHGSIYLADQKLPITVPRVRDQRAVKIREFFSQGDWLDYGVLSQLDHIRTNWDLIWDPVGKR